MAGPRSLPLLGEFASDEDRHRAGAVARLGSVLGGKYRLDRVLGIGGMAVVFAATHRNQKQLAIKMLHPEVALSADIRARFLREGYAANSLRHAGAVSVLDDDVAEDGAPYLVMELLEGDELDRLLSRGGEKLPTRTVLAIAYQLLDVLAAAHAKGIVHRDVKPANLFLTVDGTLKVLDFGIARVRDGFSTGKMSTGTGMVLGTPAFMAPEQALGKAPSIDGQTDVWAAGATLFACLSGRCVHEGETGPQLLILAATTPSRPLSSVAPDVPPSVAQIVDRAIAFDKEARWPNAEAMRDAIGEAYRDLYGAAVSREPLVELLRAHPPLPPAQTLQGAASGSVSAPYAATQQAVSQTGLRTDGKPVTRDMLPVAQVDRAPPRGARIVVAAVAVASIALVAVAAFELGGRLRSSTTASTGAASALLPSPVAILPPVAASAAPSTAVPPASVATVIAVAAPSATVRLSRPAMPPTGAGPRPSTPCNLVTTVDRNGETHFSCPCSKCQ